MAIHIGHLTPIAPCDSPVRPIRRLGRSNLDFRRALSPSHTIFLADLIQKIWTDPFGWPTPGVTGLWGCEDVRDGFFLIYKPRPDYGAPLILTVSGVFRDDMKYAMEFKTPNEAEAYRLEHGHYDLRDDP